MNYLVGLTGGIGSGKSTVAKMFAALGVRIIDTDCISRELTQPNGKAMNAIRDAFGAHFIDSHGALDRNRMRELVFANQAEKKRLEAILHPLILELAKQRAASATKAPYTLVIVPLLFESGCYGDWLHHVLAVECPEAQQITRTMQRSRLDETAVRAIMAQQLGNAERQRLADEVIRNGGSLDELQQQITSIHYRLCAAAAQSN